MRRLAVQSPICLPVPMKLMPTVISPAWGFSITMAFREFVSSSGWRRLRYCSTGFRADILIFARVCRVARVRLFRGVPALFSISPVIRDRFTIMEKSRHPAWIHTSGSMV